MFVSKLRLAAPSAVLVYLLVGASNTLSAGQKVIMHLDYLVNGYHAPFYVAKAKGWYDAAGLDVTIRPGRGTADSIKNVATGQAQFGLPGLGATVKAISEGINVTAVAAYLQISPGGIVSFADKPVREPKDLEGKSLSVAPFGATAMMLPAFAKKNGVDMRKVKTITYNFGAMVPSFLTGKVDSTIGYYFGEFLAARTKSNNRKVIFLRFADHGIDAYANGIIVNNDFMKSNPKAVRAFVQTSLRGLRHTIAHIDEAVTETAKHTETAAATLRQQLALALELIDTPSARKYGFGVMTDEKWTATQGIQLGFNKQKRSVPLAKVYTNRFAK